MLSMVEVIRNRADPAARHYLKEWRRKRSLTGEALAELMGTDKGTISRLESGKKRLNEDLIYDAASALEITPDQIFRSPDELSLDSLVSSIPDDLKRHIFTMVAAVANRDGK